MPPLRSLIFLLCLLAASVFPQNLNENHAKIRGFVEKKDYPNAIAELKSIQKQNPQVFAANNYDYLLARLAEKNGDPADAAANYQTVVGRDSVLKEYALWHLSQIMRDSGNLLMERLYLQELSISTGKSLLRDAVRKRFTRSHFESGNYPEAIKLIDGRVPVVKVETSVIENIKDQIPIFGENIPREDLVLLAQSYLQNKETGRAREIFRELVDNPPDENQPDDYALAGAKGLDLLDGGEENFGKTAPKLDAEEHLKRAEIYQFNRNFSFARLHYEAVVENHTAHEKVPFAMYQTGRGYVQERDEEKAIEWFERLLKVFPEDALAASALYQAAGSYANSGKTSEAVSRYLKFIEENPNSGNLERAFLNIIDAYRDANNPRAALDWTLRMREKFNGRTGEALALFAQIKTHLSQENWQNALGDLDALSRLNNFGGNTAGGTNKTEVEFLRGFVLEKLGRFNEAVEVHLSIEDGLKNYYGGRASERLENLSADPKTAGLVAQIFGKYQVAANATLTNDNAEQIAGATRKAFRLTQDKEKRDDLNRRIARAYELLEDYREIPNGRISDFGRREVLQNPQKTKTHKVIADELLFLGLYDEATPELETALREDLTNNTGSLSDFPPATAFTLAVFYKRGDMAHRSLGHIEALWRKVPNDYHFALVPHERLELLYPKPFEAALLKYGREKKVDPRFVLSIMRQESRFQADVKSSAAARGLMQFISTTAEQMADEMKIENFHQDDLYNPPTAIRFGSHYIAKMFRDFPDQPAAVAAGYNGGEDRMMRWLKRSNANEPERYVPEVVFVQTKDYVYKVMANYRVYRLLYDENLQ
jgi:soluble lytic murein transglycosylase